MKRLLLFFVFSLCAVEPWTAASSAQEAVSRTLTLEEVLRDVSGRNPEIIAARSRAQAAEERIPQARAPEDLQVGVIQWSIPSNFNIGRAEETWYTLSQYFPFFGKRALRENVASLERDMAGEDSRGVLLRVTREAKEAYFDLFFAHKALEIHHEQIELTRKLSLIVQEKLALGAVGQQELLRARIELLNLSNDLETAAEERKIAEARLNTLMNRPTEAITGIPQAPLLPTVEPKFETLLREAEASRPENRLHTFEIRRNEAAVKLARRDLLPDFMAEVAYWDVHDGSNRWMASIKMTVPWINKKKYVARIRENEAERSRAQSALQATINETALQIKATLARLEKSKRQAGLYETGLLPLAEQSLEAATIGYQSKKNDLMTVIDAQKNLKELEMTYFRALTEIQKSLAELEEMTGKTF